MTELRSSELQLTRTRVIDMVPCPTCESPKGLPCLRLLKRAWWTDDGGPGYGPDDQIPAHRLRWRAARTLIKSRRLGDP